MSILHLVLFEPQIPPNTGNIARLCSVTGARLHLVEPLGFAITDKTLKRAGLDYWHTLNVTMYKDSASFFAQNTGPYYCFTTKAQRLYTDVVYPHEVFLLFGREDRGLPLEILSALQEHCLRLPMLPERRSLNLSSSVAVAAYEVLRQWHFPQLL